MAFAAPRPPERARRLALTEGVALGGFYALVVFAVFRQVHLLPTMAFLVLVPAALGAVPQLIADEDQISLYVNCLMRPWMSVIAFLVGTAVFFREAGVCLIVLAIPFLAMSVFGALIVWIYQAHKLSVEKRKKAALLLALLPLIFAPLEGAYLMRTEERSASCSVEIEAPASAVFARLAEVETIQESEYRSSLFTWLGVPRPIRATIDRAALGGKRVGEFEYGLRFDEVITRFDVDRAMAFSIGVDPRSLRVGSAERHAFETGYFRFHDATYRLEALSMQRTRLHLSSSYMIRSGWNAYGRLWSHALITDFQDHVLAILKSRIERDRSRHASVPVVGAGD